MRSTSSRVTTSAVSASTMSLCSHCHTCEREISAVAALHQVEDRHRSRSPQPGREVLDADADVVSKPRLGHLAGRRGDVQQLFGRDMNVLAKLVDLVGTLTEYCGERRLAHLDHAGVRDPGSVEPGAGLAGLVLFGLG